MCNKSWLFTCYTLQYCIYFSFFISIICFVEVTFISSRQTLRGGGGILVKSSVLNFRLLATFFLNIQPRFHSINKLDIFFTTFFFFFYGFSNVFKCVVKCREDNRRQSFNLVISLLTCEFNNRTKEARPEDFIPNSDGSVKGTLAAKK